MPQTPESALPGRPWLVLSMDVGVVRREPTRAAAVQWMIAHHGGCVRSRHCYGPGAYEYSVGPRDEETGYFVERLDAAEAGGWGWSFALPDLYPFPDRPHSEDLEIDRDALLAALGKT